MPVTIEFWLTQREVHRHTDEASTLDLAFATFFLNLTSKSGIVSGGVIGGLDQTGPYKIDARYNKPELSARIRKIARHRHQILITELDAKILPRACRREQGRHPSLPRPPVLCEGAGPLRQLLRHPKPRGDRHSRPGAFALLGRVLRRCAEIIAMYCGAPCIRYGLAYSAAKRQQGSEAMFFSPDLSIPDAAPASVPSAVLEQARQPAFF